MSEKPYLQITRIEPAYNPNYGNDRICACGHPYYRHFDTYNEMEPVGCKYCDCMEFVEMVGGVQPTPCPCTLADTPCHDGCSCINPLSSSGCSCCCTFGSEEQRKARANQIVSILRVNP